jgi:hypothetical protein
MLKVLLTDNSEEIKKRKPATQTGIILVYFAFLQIADN